MIRKEQICEIRTPFPVDFICCEILIKFIVEYFTRFSVLIFRLLWAGNGMESPLCIHIFMNGSCTIRVASALQIDFHAPVTINTIVGMIDFLNLCVYFCFMGIIIRLPVFLVVIIRVWTDFKPTKEPPRTKQLMILLNKPISL